ncbi:MAG: hypothetical protein ABIJ97_14080 [Bacteroidota bacterium]
MKDWIKKIMIHFLLILFLGYLGSITLFTHRHILNGVTFVHSHPYSHGTEKNPVNHQHTTNGFILIHFLSHFLTTATFLVFSFEVFKAVFKKYIFQKNEDNSSNLAFLYSNGLRAPPLNIHN